MSSTYITRLFFYDLWLKTFAIDQRPYCSSIAQDVPELLAERSNRLLAFTLEKRAELFSRIALLSIELGLQSTSEAMRLHNSVAFQYAAVVATELQKEYLNQTTGGQTASKYLLNMCLLAIAGDFLRAQRFAKFVLRFPTLEDWQFINGKNNPEIESFLFWLAQSIANRAFAANYKEATEFDPYPNFIQHLISGVDLEQSIAQVNDFRMARCMEKASIHHLGRGKQYWGAHGTFEWSIAPFEIHAANCLAEQLGLKPNFKKTDHPWAAELVIEAVRTMGPLQKNQLFLELEKHASECLGQPVDLLSVDSKGLQLGVSVRYYSGN